MEKGIDGIAGTAGAEESDLISIAASLKEDMEETEAGRVARGIGGASDGVRE